MGWARTIVRVLAAGWMLLVLLACCSSRMVAQSGLVPFSEPDPPPSSHGVADVNASASGLTFLDGTAGAESGAYAPAAQLHLGGMLRPIGGFMIRPMGMLGLPTGADPTRPGLIAPPGAPSFGAGVDLGYVIGDEHEPYVIRPHLGGALAGIAMNIQDPAGSPGRGDIGWMGVVEGGLDLGAWVTPWLQLLGSIDLRSMPRVPALVLACGSGGPFIDFGTFTMSVRASGEVQITDGFSIFAGVTVPAYGSPFVSFPILTLGVRGTFGDASRGMFGRRARPPPSPLEEPEPPPSYRRDAPTWGPSH